jgi:hypothetical protein
MIERLALGEPDELGPPQRGSLFAEQFRRIGEEVAHRWNSSGRDPDAFRSIGSDALRAARPWMDFDVRELLAFLASPGCVATRQNILFSDLPVLFYADADFRVELLLWSNSTTQVHDHGFRGAFALLQGSSLHSVFRFHEPRAGTPVFSAGSLTLETCKLLRPGTVVEIAEAPRFIHSAFHLSIPTATLVVRTSGTDPSLVQREYHPPGIALASDHTSSTMAGEALRLLALCDPDAAIRHLLDVTRSGEPELLFRLFLAFPWGSADRAGSRNAFAALMERPFGRSIFDALRTATRTERLMGLRAKLTTVEQRMALGATAVLGNLPAVVDFLRSAGIADPPALLAECVTSDLEAQSGAIPLSSREVAALRRLLDPRRLPAAFAVDEKQLIEKVRKGAFAMLLAKPPAAPAADEGAPAPCSGPVPKRQVPAAAALPRG